MKEADFYEVTDQTKHFVQCHLCNHHCLIKDGSRGRCRVRENQGGKLLSLVYGRIISENVDPIEKKPIFHLKPGSLSYSIATVGCNFKCLHCQNYEISQYPYIHSGKIPGMIRSPESIVTAAAQQNCQSISYTYVEPTIFFEFAYETSELANAAGIKNVFVSNGYTSPEAVRKIAPYLDANNIDLKAFSEKFYHDVCGARLAPVLETINLMKELGVWVEVTTLVIPGWNDSDKELKSIADFIMGIDSGIPWHVTGYYPTYKMTDHPPTSVAGLFRAREIGLDAGLKYVYAGNIPGQGGEDTYCPSCKKVVIHRTGYRINAVNLDNGACSFCGEIIGGIF